MALFEAKVRGTFIAEKVWVCGVPDGSVQVTATAAVALVEHVPPEPDDACHIE